jgi:hypothetical protein
MKRCRHLQDFLIESKPVGPNTGVPPFIALCEDCAAGAKEALEIRIKAIADSKPSGKGGRAQVWAWSRRIVQDISADLNIGHDVQLVATQEKLQQECYNYKVSDEGDPQD